ncbi:MAG: enhanced serine sensitivity protein SseB C-terminal domain-containing protein [Rhizomicrobium sp.]
MAFLPENPLEETLARAVSDPLARPEFYRLLMESELVVLGRAAGEPLQLTIAALRHNGREYLPAFSALSRLTTFAGAGREHFRMPARTLFETTKGVNFTLNPNCACGKLLTAAEIAYWLDPSARARRRLRATEVRLAAAPAPPRKLIDALGIFFRNRGSVLAAHLLEAAPLDGSEPPHPLIGIETTDNWSKIAAEVSALAAAVSPETILDLVPIDRAEPPESLSGRLAQTPPFYARTPVLN